MTQTYQIAALDKSITFQLDLDLNDQNDKWIIDHMQSGCMYEPEVLWVMLRALKPGDIVIDIGANVGFFSVIMAKLVGQDGAVVAFEPGDIVREIGIRFVPAESGLAKPPMPPEGEPGTPPIPPIPVMADVPTIPSASRFAANKSAT